VVHASDADTPAVPPGYERIWAVTAAIPPGTVLSYGEVARRAGLPRRARLVARALREAPDTLALPWHRVVRAGGRIAFEPGSSGFIRQRQRLRAEGVEVADNGRLQPPDAATTLDELLWRP
jgi:methylated-DNA-protein-cysteine methyltransferase-like protein